MYLLKILITFLLSSTSIQVICQIVTDELAFTNLYLTDEISLLFSHEAGYYSKGFNLQISSNNTDEVAIRYTLDGSIPTKNSDLYSTSITVYDRTTENNILSNIQTYHEDQPYPKTKIFKAFVIRVAAFNESNIVSPIYTKTYIIHSDKANRFSFPVISLVTDSANLFNDTIGIYIPGASYENEARSGNYMQTGREWERLAHIEMFETDGKTAISQDAGIRIHGASSRVYTQKSLRLYAREEYGEKYFNHQLFKDKSTNKFKRFVLRSVMPCPNRTMFKDELSSEIVKNLSFDVQHYRPVIVLINGEYWGIHNIRDYFDDNYMEIEHGTDKDNFDLITQYPYSSVYIPYGTSKRYMTMMNYIRKADTDSIEAYEYIKSQINIKNFIEYQIAEIFLNNIDWPGNNIKYWCPNTTSGKWEWLFFDLDRGWGFTDNNFDLLSFASTEIDFEVMNPEWSTRLLRILLKDNDFKFRFINHFAYLMGTTLHKDTILNKLNKMKAQYSNEFDEHNARWQTRPANRKEWENNLYLYLRKFAENRPDYVHNHIINKFSLSGKVNIKVLPNEHGNIFIDENRMPNNFDGVYFKSVPSCIKAIPETGYKFVGWSDATKLKNQSVQNIAFKEDLILDAKFEKANFEDLLLINSFMADNDSSDTDEFGDHDDWIEIYNISDEAVNIGGLYISDDIMRLAKWQITKDNAMLTTIPAHSSIIFWADDELDEGDLHTSFKLSKNGDDIALSYKSDDKFIIIDQLTFNQQKTDTLYSRIPDGSQTWDYITPEEKRKVDVNDVNTSYSFVLLQNFPNPFSHLTNIVYSIKKLCHVNIAIIDMRGQLVKILVNKIQKNGTHKIIWDGTNSNGNKITSGIYLYKITTENNSQTKKMFFIE